MATLREIKSAYQTFAVILLNTILVIVFVNVAAALVLAVLPKKGKAANVVVQKYDLERLAKVYPGYSKEQVVELLDEIWTGPLQYAPFVQFQERAFEGKYVRVSTNGFRVGKDQAGWPISESNFNIFVFGGSTTFGYGVADAETVPSFLQEALRAKTKPRPRSSVIRLIPLGSVAVYNFGRGFYYSTQERILFEQLLSAGIRPNLAVFVDGLNEFVFRKDEPRYTKVLSNFMNQSRARDAQTNEPALGFSMSWMPLAKLVKRFAAEPRPQESTLETASKENAPAQFDEKDNDLKFFGYLIERWESNRRLIEAAAEKFGVKVAFVMQPVPVYQYDLSHHLFAPGGFSSHSPAHFGYAMMDQHFQKHSATNIFWAGDLQKSLKKPLYVDKVHYTAEMSRIFAESISDFLVRGGFLAEKP